MPVPTNTTPTTAMVIPSLPFTITQNLTGVLPVFGEIELWYVYTAAPGDNVIRALSYKAGGNTDAPWTEIYLGPAAAPVAYLGAVSFINGREQVPVTPGTSYYFRAIADDPGAGLTYDLQFSVLAFADQPIADGDLLINSDKQGYPASTVDPATGEVKRFIQGIVAGETVDQLADGRRLFSDKAGGLALYDADLNLITTIPSISGNVGGGNKVDRFYVLVNVGAAIGGTATIQAIEANGSIGASWGPLPANSFTNYPQLVAVTADETIAYITNARGDGIVGSNILRWDLVNNVQLSDLVGTMPGEYLAASGVSPGGLLVMDDGSVLVSYWDGPLSDSNVRRYDAAGVLLNIYTGINLLDRISLDYGAPASFWAWSKPSYGTAAWRKIHAGDGAVLSETTGGIEVQDGGAMKLVADQTAREFGSPFSCPFLVMGASTPPPPPPDPHFGCVVPLPVSASGDTCVVPLPIAV